jgi:tRNA threonylcarbamoyladenosine modification (KEOPS) complex Cgi121 subunit
MFLSDSSRIVLLEPVYSIDSLGMYFALLLVDSLPEEWVSLATELKKNRRFFIQFFKPDCIVSEIIPFLAYNVHQAFKHGYNVLRGFEQELLVALYGKRSFQEASCMLGASVSQRAAILVISEDAAVLREALNALKEEFSKMGLSLEPFQEDEKLFTSFWRNLFSKDFNVDALNYSDVLELVKERIALLYV